MSDILAINTEEDFGQGTRKCKLPSLSVYTYDWKWNTWRGFWKNIKQWFDNRAAAKQRAKWGYCYGDIWNCGDTICCQMAHMLTEFRNKCNSWPDGKFDSFEEWIAFIDEIIDLLEIAECDPDELNCYAEEYNKVLMVSRNERTPEQEELSRLYYKEEIEIYERQKSARMKALTMFAENAPYIWW